MTHLTIFGFSCEGDDADSILFHANSDEAQARGREWLGEEEHHFFDYMKIMVIDGAGVSEVARLYRSR